MYTQIDIYKPHGNHKPKIYNRYTPKKEKRIQTQHQKYSNHNRREQKKKGTKNKHKNNPKTINKMAIKTYVSIIPLNVNGLNSPIKRHIVPGWIQKQDPYICCLQRLTSNLKTHTD